MNSCSAMTLVFKTSWFCYFTAFTITTDVWRGQWCLVALWSYSLEGHSYKSVCSYILNEVVRNLTKIEKNLKLINFKGHRMLLKVLQKSKLLHFTMQIQLSIVEALFIKMNYCNQLQFTGLKMTLHILLSYLYYIKIVQWIFYRLSKFQGLDFWRKKGFDLHSQFFIKLIENLD